jgi:hypothetical protein
MWTIVLQIFCHSHLSFHRKCLKMTLSAEVWAWLSQYTLTRHIFLLIILSRENKSLYISLGRATYNESKMPVDTRTQCIGPTYDTTLQRNPQKITWLPFNLISLYQVIGDLPISHLRPRNLSVTRHKSGNIMTPEGSAALVTASENLKTLH